jgi:NAD(P)-dependent dehydrogenase (short-subunit alcohol dehydrogenase family)
VLSIAKSYINHEPSVHGPHCSLTVAPSPNVCLVQTLSLKQQPLTRAFLSELSQHSVGECGEAAAAYAYVCVAAYLGPRQSSEDQLDLIFQTNVLGPFLLTELLIRHANPSHKHTLRIVNVVSDSLKVRKVRAPFH